MSDAILPPCLATARPTFTMVKTGPYVIRHLAPGKPFLQLRDGEYVLIRPVHPGEMPRLSIPERLRYRINQWLIARRATSGATPLFSLRQVQLARKGSRSRRAAASHWRIVLLAKVQGGLRAVLSVDIKAVGRGALTALLTFMALIGVTRFVHVDVQTVFRSIHFAVPHFLTPWRSEDGQGNATPTSRPYAFAATPYVGNITPSTFTPPAAGSPQTGDDASRSRKANTGWLPLPGGGPFPMNMPDYGEDGQKRPFPMAARSPIFTPSEGPSDDEGSNGEPVTLLGTASTPVTAPAEPAPAPAPAHSSPKKESGSRAVVAQATHEPIAPREGNRAAPQPKHPQPQPTQQPQPQPPNRNTVDVELLPATPQPAPSATRRQNQDSQQEQEQTGSSDGKPKFKVITKNDGALVVMDHGQMKQISVGQTLPDGSTLLSVKENGGGFSTSRGNYVAY